jgi:hypothetical protein
MKQINSHLKYSRRISPYFAARQDPPSYFAPLTDALRCHSTRPISVANSRLGDRLSGHAALKHSRQPAATPCLDRAPGPLRDPTARPMAPITRSRPKPQSGSGMQKFRCRSTSQLIHLVGGASQWGRCVFAAPAVYARSRIFKHDHFAACRRQTGFWWIHAVGECGHTASW